MPPTEDDGMNHGVGWMGWLGGRRHVDYDRLVPESERLPRQHGKLRLLFDMTAFHGWDAGAGWEDFKFGLAHFADIERLAMVGEGKWQHGMATFCKPMTKATVRHFEHTLAAEARKWLGEA